MAYRMTDVEATESNNENNRVYHFRNVYLGEEGEEPVFQYVPEKRLSPGLVGAETTPLHQSLLLLEESLESGAITGQFEQLYRRNPSLAISVCHLTENAAKNR